MGPGRDDDSQETEEASRRTYLANERTYLAWWRTGLAALATGIAIGRLIPSLTHQTRWPYAVLGAGFALVGIATMAYGLVRQRAVRDALQKGRYVHPHDTVLLALTGAGIALGTLLLVLVIVRL